jgi:hypothetical protein
MGSERLEGPGHEKSFFPHRALGFNRGPCFPWSRPWLPGKAAGEATD